MDVKESSAESREESLKDSTARESNLSKTEMLEEGVPYSQKTTERIEEFTTTTLTKLDEMTSEIKQKYVTFKSTIQNHILSYTDRFAQAFFKGVKGEKDKKFNDALETFASKNIRKHLDDMFEIHSQIIDALFENLQILTSFLEVDKYLNKDQPTQEFIGHNLEKIYNSWLFQKLNFSKFNLTEILYNKEVNEDLKYFVEKNSKNKFLDVKIFREQEKPRPSEGARNDREDQKNEEIEKDLKKRDLMILKENKDILKKLLMLRIPDVESYLKVKLDKGEPLVFKELVKLVIESSRFSKLTLQDVFPNCQKLLIKSSVGFDVNSIMPLPVKLKRLSLEKNNLINCDFNRILEKISKKDSPLLGTLEYLSLANNSISCVDFNQFIIQTNQLRKLKELDFRKNKIYKFTFNPNYFKSLKSINVVFNSFSRDYFTPLKKTNIIIFANNNMYLTNENNRTKYKEDLEKKLKNHDYGLSYLSLSGLYNLSNRTDILKMKISPKIQITVKKLDLSYCGLNNETLFKFFEENTGFLDLKTLNLSGNELTEDFFTLFLAHDFHKFFSKLSQLNISNNRILGIDFTGLLDFITENKMLTKIKITKNPFSKNYAAKKRATITSRMAGGPMGQLPGQPGKSMYQKPSQPRGPMQGGEGVPAPPNQSLSFINLISRVRSMRPKDMEENKKNIGRVINFIFDLSNKLNVSIEEDLEIEVKSKRESEGPSQ